MSPFNPKYSGIISTETIPVDVIGNIHALKDAGFDAYLVGGCVRDLILGRIPKDWDITTDATPEQIQGLFSHTFYENSFGTVGVVNEPTKNKVENHEKGGIDSILTAERVVEITPYRLESDYRDGRHPEKLSFSKDIHDDLKRRDFTVNALAYDPIGQTLIDDFNGLHDLNLGVLRAVGDAYQRFNEDGLRILRAIRLSTELGFVLETNTEKAVIESADILAKISHERIRDEFIRICNSKNGGLAIFSLQRYGLLKYVIPELEEGLHVKQNQAHSFEVFEHLVRSFQCALDKEYSLEVKIAALLHDIGKPKSRRFSEQKNDYTFYGHEVIGAKMAKVILERLKFSREITDTVIKFVRWHMFFSDPDKITLSAVRRLILNVGEEHIWDLMNLRVCDRVGTGRPKEDPYRLRKYISMIEEVLRNPISPALLKINGEKLMKILNISPGPIVGYILAIILAEVIENQDLNTEDNLVSRVTELHKLGVDNLKKMSIEAKNNINMAEEGEVGEIRDKYKVK